MRPAIEGFISGVLLSFIGLDFRNWKWWVIMGLIAGVGLVEFEAGRKDHAQNPL